MQLAVVVMNLQSYACTILSYVLSRNIITNAAIIQVIEISWTETLNSDTTHDHIHTYIFCCLLRWILNLKCISTFSEMAKAMVKVAMLSLILLYSYMYVG